MKISPINFATILEPELVSFWENNESNPGESIVIQRTHNFKLVETNIYVGGQQRGAKENTPLCNVQLVEIPQQENNAAINAHIHVPGYNNPSQLLMVFKTEEDNNMWVQKILNKIESLVQDRPQETTSIEPQETTDTEPQEISDTETEEVTDTETEEPTTL